MEEKRNNIETMNNLVKAVLKNRNIKTVFNIEDKLKKLFKK